MHESMRYTQKAIHWDNQDIGRETGTENRFQFPNLERKTFLFFITHKEACSLLPSIELLPLGKFLFTMRRAFTIIKGSYKWKFVSIDQALRTLSRLSFH